MEKGYRYTAVNARNQKVTGVIFASNEDTAFARIKRAALRPLELVFSLESTFSYLMSGGQMPRKDLARFYRVLGKRFRSGRPIIDALEGASGYIRNDLIRQGAILMGQRILDGAPVHDAMLATGFPKIDAMAIRAAEGAGDHGDAFMRLAGEIEREVKLSSGIKKAMRTPKFLAVFMYLALFLATMFLAPMPEKFMKETGNKPTPTHAIYFKASHALNDSPWMWGALYFSFPVLLVAGARRVRLSRVLDAWPSWRSLSEKSDQAACWTGFGLLYGAGIPPYECSTLVSGAGKRHDTRMGFDRLSRLLSAGHGIGLAVSRSGFPDFVSAGVVAAEESGGSLATGLTDFARELAEDVEELTDLVREYVQIGSTLIGGVLFLFFAYLTLFPILTAGVMRN